MNRHNNIPIWILLFIITIIVFPSCEKILDTDQELDVTEDELYDDWYEYRSVEMGLYALQQQLVEQLVVLGELRSDLLTVTDNASSDLVEINNFDISEDNEYASPTNFFKLISACNNLIRILQNNHPEVLDAESEVTNYDKLYGEVLCMRAWTYFNAVRIYGKVPFIPASLTTIDEIMDYVNSSGTYIDSVYIEYSTDGYYNDTTYNEPITLDKNYYDTDMIIDYFTNELENDVKAVGVDHTINISDDTWEATVWGDFSMYALLGHMYLTAGDLYKAQEYFEDEIMMNTTDENRYQLTSTFADSQWGDIFTSIDLSEHLYAIWFNKSNDQQNDLQSLFINDYMLKPTTIAVENWETVWRGQSLDADDSSPDEAEMEEVGIPGDFYRGYGYSYVCVINNEAIYDYYEMLLLKAKEDDRSVEAIMEGADTLVYKYMIDQDTYDMDANFIAYRAAGIHLYMSEIYSYLKFDNNGIISTNLNYALWIVNDGSFYGTTDTDREQLGVRGRVGLGDDEDAISIGNIIYIHDPYTNEVTGYLDYTGDLASKQQYLEEQILDERARELAYEGERFYDLMRVAKRRNDPSFLAEKVSAKYASEAKQQEIYNYLLNEDNWYINYFDE